MGVFRGKNCEVLTFSLVNSSPDLCDAGQAWQFVSLRGVCDAWLTIWMKLYSTSVAKLPITVDGGLASVLSKISECLNFSLKRDEGLPTEGGSGQYGLCHKICNHQDKRGKTKNIYFYTDTPCHSPSISIRLPKLRLYHSSLNDSFLPRRPFSIQAGFTPTCAS